MNHWQNSCVAQRGEADVIISKWPEHLQNGTIFVTDQSARDYTLLAAMSMTLFWSLQLGCDPLLKALKVTSYTDLDKQNRKKVVRDIVHMAHHVINTANSLRVLFFACQEGDGFPPLETDWTYLRLFASSECRYRPLEIHMYVVIFCTSYIFWDSCRLIFSEEKLEKLDKQMVIHHAITLSALVGSIAGFVITMGASTIVGFLEISSIFLVIRRYVTPQSMAGKINDLLFFFSFTIFRIFLLLFMWYTWPMDFCAVYERLDWGIYFGWYNLLAIFAITMLNFMWYLILLKKFVKLIFPRKQEIITVAKQGNESESDKTE